MSSVTEKSSAVFDIAVTTNSNETQRLADYQGKVLLIVNTASQCGFTSQYEELETLYQRFKDRDFVVLAFPCNQFGGQEPGSDADIQQFCDLNFHTTFPLFSKVDVNGSNAHPLFQHLKAAAPGLLGTEAIKWNFTKFLVNREGEVVARFAPKESPLKLAKQVEALL